MTDSSCSLLQLYSDSTINRY